MPAVLPISSPGQDMSFNDNEQPENEKYLGANQGVFCFHNNTTDLWNLNYKRKQK